MDQAAVEDAILRHLQEVAVCKKALLQVSLEIVGEYPSQAALVLRVVKALTTSADKLLGASFEESG